ncbi:hypothetical protein EB796_015448 [Bugula neritina]|uniref:Uncharacterized protein n=1 Tax=Bugula neritina TaxID=10212 RepID=A0A7J7JIU1_BUGNE|nr:hypothetical protein EB796_015448 [Bugula neritina]
MTAKTLHSRIELTFFFAEVRLNINIILKTEESHLVLPTYIADLNIHCWRYNKQTPLHQAALDGRLDLIKLLIEHSADYKVKDNDGLLPLDFARKQGHQSCAKLLIDAQNEAEGVLARA